MRHGRVRVRPTATQAVQARRFISLAPSRPITSIGHGGLQAADLVRRLLVDRRLPERPGDCFLRGGRKGPAVRGGHFGRCPCERRMDAGFSRRSSRWGAHLRSDARVRSQARSGDVSRLPHRALNDDSSRRRLVADQAAQPLIHRGVGHGGTFADRVEPRCSTPVTVPGQLEAATVAHHLASAALSNRLGVAAEAAEGIAELSS